MRGTALAQRSWSQVGVICGELLDQEGFLATLWPPRGKLFTDSDFDGLYSSNKGRPAVGAHRAGSLRRGEGEADDSIGVAGRLSAHPDKVSLSRFRSSRRRFARTVAAGAVTWSRFNS